MQLSAKSIVLDYYPIKTWSNNIIPEKYLRILTFKGQTQTKRIISKETSSNPPLNVKTLEGFSKKGSGRSYLG